jgi:anaerobic ribonucleoside-triphosphate reductase activating protein
MRVARVLYPVTALGPGVRLGVWVQGCSLACKGCMSRDTWSPQGGEEVSVDELLVLWREAVAAGADGITVSGGEPLQQPEALGELLAGVRQVRADRELDVLVYTGYTEEEFDEARWRAVEHCDVLVVGRYDVTKPTSLIWRGSANQRLLPLTAQGRRRYDEHVGQVPDRPTMQVMTDGDATRVIGVPRPGDLAELERGLRAAGLGVTGVTWRP